MRKKTAAFIGTGAIAREHMFAMQFIDGVEVAALCDLSPARAESSAERFKVAKVYTSHAEMLDAVRPDFVHIATPPQSHFALAKDCLERGFNVICEKPIASSLEQFQTLKGIAEAKSLLLIENQNYRTNSSVQKILALKDAGELGDILDVQVELQVDVHGKGSVYVDPNVPHFTATLKGGVVSDFITHMAYLAQLFIGPEAKAATVWRRQAGSGTEPNDEFRALLQSPTGAGYLSFSGNAQPQGFWLKVQGTKARAEANLFDAPRMSVRRQRGEPPPLATVKDAIVEARNISGGSLTSLYRKFSGKARYDGLEPYLRQCYAALDDRGALPATLADIEATYRLIEQLYADGSRL